MSGAALVLSGGGSKGAFQVGALKYFAEQNYTYNKFCGVSVGAINAAHLAMHKDFAKGVESLERLWLDLNTESVHRRWFPFGYFHALWKLSARDSSPLQELINCKFDIAKLRETGNKLYVGAVSLRTREYRLFDQDCPNIVEAIIGSSAFPGMLEPGYIEDQYWVDGGVRNVTPLKAAIQSGANKIDAIIASASVGVQLPEPKNVLNVLMTTLEILVDEVLINDIKMAEMYNRLLSVGALEDKRVIELRKVISLNPLPGDSLEFNPTDIKCMIAMGYEAARRQIGG